MNLNRSVDHNALIKTAKANATGVMRHVEARGSDTCVAWCDAMDVSEQLAEGCRRYEDTEQCHDIVSINDHTKTTKNVEACQASDPPTLIVQIVLERRVGHVCGVLVLSSPDNRAGVKRRDTEIRKTT